jgi:ketosteroid isomerase-like protein
MARARCLPSLLLLGLLTAGRASGQPPTAPAAPAVDTPEANQAVVGRYFQILGGGVMADLDQVVGADFVDRTPGTPGDLHGPEAIRASQRRARELFENVRYTVDDLFAAGDRVAARYTVRATRKGAGGGGQPVEVTGATIFRLAGGKVREAWIFNDQIELFRQLGFTLRPPAEAPKPAAPPAHPGR